MESLLCKSSSKAMAQLRTVVHNYHDYATVAVDHASSDETIFNDPKTGLDRNFPVKLHFVLRQLSLEGCEDIASWAPHGRCFIVHKPCAFETQVLRKYVQPGIATCFGQSSRFVKMVPPNEVHFVSTTAQPIWIHAHHPRYSLLPIACRTLFSHVNTSGLDRHGYYHELFLRNKAFLSAGIKRMKVKGCGARKASAPEHEPNFYNMPFLPDPPHPLAAKVRPSRHLLPLPSTCSPLGNYVCIPRAMPPSSMGWSCVAGTVPTAPHKSPPSHLSMAIKFELHRDIAQALHVSWPSYLNFYLPHLKSEAPFLIPTGRSISSSSGPFAPLPLRLHDVKTFEPGKSPLDHRFYR